MLGFLIGFASLIALGGLIWWCLGGEFKEGARNFGGCIVEIILAIIFFVILGILDSLGIIG